MQSAKRKPDDSIRLNFRRGGYVGLYVAGARSPVPRGINERGWPIRVGLTKALEDVVTQTLDGNSPYWPQGVLFRVWVQGWDTGRQLEDLVKTTLLDGKEVRKSYFCMGEKFSPAEFEKSIHALAGQHHIHVWDDALLMAELLRVQADRMRRRAG